MVVSRSYQFNRKRNCCSNGFRCESIISQCDFEVFSAGKTHAIGYADTADVGAGLPEGNLLVRRDIQSIGGGGNAGGEGGGVGGEGRDGQGGGQGQGQHQDGHQGRGCNGDGGNDTVNTIKEKLKELINEMSGELATRLLESYANMPT